MPAFKSNPDFNHCDGESDGDASLLESASKTKIDSFLSREMMKLSVTDRNAIHEEIHGVRNLAVVETPELIEASLNEFKSLFDAVKIKADHFEIHRLEGDPTKAMRPLYHTETRAYRLVFLRCEFFNVRKAALRYLRHLDFVCEVFGTAALKRPLSVVKDFDKNELRCLRKGHHQLLPVRDQAGRRVFAALADVGFALDARTRSKVVFYMFSKAVEDVDTQRNGIVMILFPAASTIQETQDHIETDEVNTNANMHLCFKLLECMPVRIAAYHMCLPDTKWFRMFCGMATLVGLKTASMRARLKIHVGGPVELKYDILGYGIPMDSLPITEGGIVKTKHIKQWIKLRAILDEEEEEYTDDSSESRSGTSSPVPNSKSFVDCPTCRDMLFRSGKTAMFHPGNIMFRSMVESKSEKHTECSRTGKKSIVRELIEAVEDIGGRFLVWDKNGWWKKIEEAEIKAKIGTFIRNFKSTQRARENLQVNDSGTYAFTDGMGNNNNNNSNSSKRRKTIGATTDSVTSSIFGASSVWSSEG